MLARRRSPWLLALLLALSSGGVSSAGPQDTRVGETRLTYDKAGTVLRATPSATGAPVVTLPANTPVQVVEVKLPWVRVQAQGQEGWLKAFQAIEPAALSAAPSPASLSGSGSGNVSERDAAAAGRQLDAGTERGYRAGRQDLERAYLAVDEMERLTAAMDPAESLTFIMGGDIGRRGCTYRLPGRLPPQPDYEEGGGKKAPDLGDVAKLGGDLFGKFGGKHAKEVEKGAKLLGALGGYMKKLNERFTPKQLYYLGRAVAANAIARYRVDPDPARRAYVRHVGDALLRTSNRAPANYGGYHFEVLDSDEVNGVSGPGGFVLVTRGAVLACKTEDELAGILAHELAHVIQNHGEQTLRKSQSFQNNLQLLGGIAGAVTDQTDARWTQGLVKFFSESVGEMSRTSLEHAYGKGFENEADQIGTYILYEDYYDWAALRNYLQALAQKPDAHGDTATHASPAQRAAMLDAVIAPYGAFPTGGGILEERRERFDVAMRRATVRPPAPPAPPPSVPPPPPPPTPLPTK